MIPKKWPKRFTYSKESVSPELHLTLLRNYLHSKKPEHFQKTSWVIQEKCIHPHVQIKKITNQNHLLYHQKTSKGYPNYGLFATETLPANTELGEYVGELYLRTPECFEETAPRTISRSEYIWQIKINKLFSLLIDAQNIANEMALINDYRRIATCPNVKLKPIIHLGVFYFGYVTICEIQKGEEILTDYGEKFWKVHKP